MLNILFFFLSLSLCIYIDIDYSCYRTGMFMQIFPGMAGLPSRPVSTLVAFNLCKEMSTVALPSQTLNRNTVPLASTGVPACEN